jgi:hypothetical protein
VSLVSVGVLWEGGLNFCCIDKCKCRWDYYSMLFIVL